jgi:hypothetical protein
MTQDQAIQELNAALPDCGWMIAKGRVGDEPVFAIHIYDRIDHSESDEPVVIAKGEGDDFSAMVQEAIRAARNSKQ